MDDILIPGCERILPSILKYVRQGMRRTRRTPGRAIHVAWRLAERQENYDRIAAIRHTPFRTDTFCALCGRFDGFLFSNRR